MARRCGNIPYEQADFQVPDPGEMRYIVPGGNRCFRFQVRRVLVSGTEHGVCLLQSNGLHLETEDQETVQRTAEGDSCASTIAPRQQTPLPLPC